MATEIRMPQLGVSMEYGTIFQWFKSKGEEVKAGEVIASINTEKLTSDIVSEVDGIVLAIIAEEG
ncbi:MAG: 2-oxo acid dehydrogenase subunit E2, partial [Firmicutes bacterium]|nr:2-oxo acid dehydrogenase subunit E2 [Bacillota bacterium]